MDLTGKAITDFLRQVKYSSHTKSTLVDYASVVSSVECRVTEAGKEKADACRNNDIKIKRK